MVDRNALRLSSALYILGRILTIGAGILHPGHEDPNSHVVVFTEYAGSSIWIADHLSQFVAFAVIAIGLFNLYQALNIHCLATYAVLQAVDGAVLKRAMMAWVNGPTAEKAARFASAEIGRWMEEGTRSYYDFQLGLTFLLLRIVVISSRPGRWAT